METNNKKSKKSIDVNDVMNVFTLRFFDQNIQNHYQKNQERQLVINRKVVKGGLFLIGLGFLIDNFFIDKNYIKGIYTSSILIAASICLFVFEKFILRYFSLIISVLCIVLVILDLSYSDKLDGGAFVQKHLWVIYNNGIILMTHIIVALSCVPEWYYRTAILASSTQFAFIGQFVIQYYNNYIQLEIVFFIAVASFYFEEKRAKKMYYRKQMKKKELESWKLMLDQIVPVSVFVVNKESQLNNQNQNSNTISQHLSQTNIIQQNINLDQSIIQTKMNIEFMNKTCLKTFDIQSKDEFQQKLRKILVKKRYTQKPHVNFKDLKNETPSHQQVISPLFRRSPNSQTSFYRQDVSLRTFNYRKNIYDLETYSKNLFKIIETLRNPRLKLQLQAQQNTLKMNLQAESVSSKSNNNTIQIHNIQQGFSSNNYQIEMANTNDNQTSQNSQLKQHQYLNCKYITYSNSTQNGNTNQKERKIQYYDIRLIESVWNGKDSIIGVITDVSEQVMAERKQEMMSYKNSVMNTITHDLKTPLNGIQLILGSSIEGNKSRKKELKESIKNALIQGHLLESRINDLLDYSKLVHAVDDFSDVKVNIDNFDINESILFCMSLYKQSANRKGINLFFNNINLISELQQDNAFPVIISNNDKQRFQQILINLLGNALKFTFEGSIKVKTEVLSQNELHISVVDTGIGMPESLKINLQDKSQNFQFETKSPEKKNMRHGIGLGLDVSKRLIRLITKEDSLRASSEQNIGTTITFKMLLNYENQEQLSNSNNEKNLQNQSQSSSIQVSTERSTGIKSNYNIVPMFNPKFIEKNPKNTILKIMIVDDTSFNVIALQSFIQKILQGKCIIDVAYNGLQAINIYKKRLQEQRKKHPFQQTVFQESELHNKCDVSEFENSFLSDNIVNDINGSSEVNSQSIGNRFKQISQFGKKENLNIKSPYDTIFMDINMPIMDGYQAINTIRNLEKSCGMEYPAFIAVVTAFGEECDRQDSINIGANYHITKPLKQEQLKLILDNCKIQQFQNQV